MAKKLVLSLGVFRMFYSKFFSTVCSLKKNFTRLRILITHSAYDMGKMRMLYYHISDSSNVLWIRTESSINQDMADELISFIEQNSDEYNEIDIICVGEVSSLGMNLALHQYQKPVQIWFFAPDLGRLYRIRQALISVFEVMDVMLAAFS